MHARRFRQENRNKHVQGSPACAASLIFIMRADLIEEKK
jgi:hypothetical protein